jgi:mycothiol synthase
MNKAGFEGWDGERLATMLKKVLPEGFFVIVHCATGKIVAAAMATHSPTELHPYGGELSWVAAAPEHRGKGLGLAVSAQAAARLIQAGYRNIYLLTDDFRLPAIKTYLKLGYEPLLCCQDMAERWESVYRKLGLEVPKGAFTGPPATESNLE